MSSSIPVNLIRQWCYCPRIVYYMELTEYTVVYPLWVNQGEKFHLRETHLWSRRNLSRFNIKEGKIYLNRPLESPDLGIHGISDMFVETEEFIYPVEFKINASTHKKGGILQLAAYSMLLQKIFQKESPVGFLAEGQKIIHKIQLSKNLKEDVKRIISSIQKMLVRGIKPDTSATLHQCSNCEYQNYCNDRC